MSLLKLNRKHGPREHAQAIVEFAIALPILMFMLVGILEVGRLIYAYAAVINASREGGPLCICRGIRRWDNLQEIPVLPGHPECG